MRAKDREKASRWRVDTRPKKTRNKQAGEGGKTSDVQERGQQKKASTSKKRKARKRESKKSTVRSRRGNLEERGSEKKVGERRALSFKG